ncbi:unnamed protein product [Amoebophrya sp. A120]|nr:unnamed protein product [Amoebophrya sp. A120]|eukprot:GSA120T00020837001.1
MSIRNIVAQYSSGQLSREEYYAALAEAVEVRGGGEEEQQPRRGPSSSSSSSSSSSAGRTGPLRGPGGSERTKKQDHDISSPDENIVANYNGGRPGGPHASSSSGSTSSNKFLFSAEPDGSSPAPQAAIPRKTAQESELGTTARQGFRRQVEYDASGKRVKVKSSYDDQGSFRNFGEGSGAGQSVQAEGSMGSFNEDLEQRSQSRQETTSKTSRTDSRGGSDIKSSSSRADQTKASRVSAIADKEQKSRRSSASMRSSGSGEIRAPSSKNSSHQDENLQSSFQEPRSSAAMRSVVQGSKSMQEEEEINRYSSQQQGKFSANAFSTSAGEPPRGATTTGGNSRFSSPFAGGGQGEDEDSANDNNFYRGTTASRGGGPTAATGSLSAARFEKSSRQLSENELQQSRGSFAGDVQQHPKVGDSASAPSRSRSNGTAGGSSGNSTTKKKQASKPQPKSKQPINYEHNHERPEGGRRTQGYKHKKQMIGRDSDFTFQPKHRVTPPSRSNSPPYEREKEKPKWMMLSEEENCSFSPRLMTAAHRSRSHSPQFKLSTSPKRIEKNPEYWGGGPPQYMLQSEDRNCTFTPKISTRAQKYQLPNFRDRLEAWAAKSREKRKRLVEKSMEAELELAKQQPGNRGSAPSQFDPEAMGRSMHDSQVAHKQRILAYVSQKHGHSESMKKKDEQQECTFQPDLRSSKDSFERVRETMAPSTRTGARDRVRTPDANKVVADILKHGRSHYEEPGFSLSPTAIRTHLDGARHAKCREEQPTFKPRVNSVRPEMTAAKLYLTSDVFTRLTEGVLYSRDLKDDQQYEKEHGMGRWHIKAMEKELQDEEEAKFAAVIEARHGVKKEEGPNWWRIQRFLWHQNLCEERRLLNLDDLGKTYTVQMKGKPQISGGSRYLADKLVTKDLYIPPGGSGQQGYSWRLEAAQKAENKECTFQPKISQRSRSVERDWRILYEDAAKRRERNKEREKQQGMDQLQGATFHPRISEFAKSRSGVINSSGALDDYLAHLQKKDERLLLTRQKYVDRMEQVQRELCPFKPNLMHAAGHVPKVESASLDTFKLYNELRHARDAEVQDRIGEEKNYAREQARLARSRSPDAANSSDGGNNNTASRSRSQSQPPSQPRSRSPTTTNTGAPKMLSEKKKEILMQKFAHDQAIDIPSKTAKAHPKHTPLTKWEPSRWRPMSGSKGGSKSRSSPARGSRSASPDNLPRARRSLTAVKKPEATTKREPSHKHGSVLFNHVPINFDPTRRSVRSDAHLSSSTGNDTSSVEQGAVSKLIQNFSRENKLLSSNAVENFSSSDRSRSNSPSPVPARPPSRKTAPNLRETNSGLASTAAGTNFGNSMNQTDSGASASPVMYHRGVAIPTATFVPRKTAPIEEETPKKSRVTNLYYAEPGSGDEALNAFYKGASSTQALQMKTNNNPSAGVPKLPLNSTGASRQWAQARREKEDVWEELLGASEYSNSEDVISDVSSEKQQAIKPSTSLQFNKKNSNHQARDDAEQERRLQPKILYQPRNPQEKHELQSAQAAVSYAKAVENLERMTKHISARNQFLEASLEATEVAELDRKFGRNNNYAGGSTTSGSVGPRWDTS